MSASVRMDEQLLARLKEYAKAADVSASTVVREALTMYLDRQLQDPCQLGVDRFGRYRSQTDDGSSRSADRKQIVRGRILGQR